MSDHTKKTDAWMPLWIGDYLADTMSLNTMQHGAYLLLLVAYWRNKGPLPDDDGDLAATVKATPAEWRKLRPKMLKFFEVEGGYWTHSRANKELDRAGIFAKKAHDRAVKAAAARWSQKGESQPDEGVQKACLKHAPSIAQEVLDRCPTPSPSPDIGIPTLVAKDEDHHHHQAGGGVDNLTEGKKPETPVTTTAAGRICKLMKQAGLQQVNPGNVTLKVLIDAGATDAEFVEAAQAAVKKGAGFSYALSVVTNERKRAADLVGQIKHGAMGGKQDPLQDPDSRESIEAAGVELGLGKWVAFDSATGRSEPWPAYAARVRRAQGRAPSAEAAQLGNLVLANIGQRATRQTAAMGGA